MKYGNRELRIQPSDTTAEVNDGIGENEEVKEDDEEDDDDDEEDDEVGNRSPKTEANKRGDAEEEASSCQSRLTLS